jgi:hypothetical protein
MIMAGISTAMLGPSVTTVASARFVVAAHPGPYAMTRCEKVTTITTMKPITATALATTQPRLVFGYPLAATSVTTGGDGRRPSPLPGGCALGLTTAIGQNGPDTA